MKIGIFGINNGPLCRPDLMLEVARCAEAAGIESLWTGEHIVLPDPHVAPAPVPPEYPMLDPSAALSFLAAATERVRLATGIIIVPQRNAVELAKELASVDVLSGGRLIFGIGVGYLKPEFDALGVSFADKGPRTDEAIDAIRALWLEPKPSFRGRFVSFSGINAFPRPVQQPPPVVVGGWSPGALRRAVERGNGWYGFALDVEATRGCVLGLRDAAKRFERPAALGTLELSVTPPPGEIDADTVAQYAELGIDRLVLLPGSFGREPAPAEYRAWIEGIARLGEAS